jgi:hypothetical protein
VLAPSVVYADSEIVLTFEVEPAKNGGNADCQGNELVPYEVSLVEPLDDRKLVDGACLSDGEAKATSYCRRDGVRWPNDEQPLATDVDVAGQWQLEGAELGEGYVAIPSDASLILTVRGEKTTAFAPCEIVSLKPHVDGDAVSFAPGGQSVPDLDCLQPRNPSPIRAVAYFKALDDVDHAERTSSTMVLAGPDVVLTFRRLQPLERRVTLTVGHCFIEPIRVEGTKWVTRRTYMGAGGGLPRRFTSEGTFTILSALEATFVADGGAEVAFKVAPKPLPTRGCR